MHKFYRILKGIAAVAVIGAVVLTGNARPARAQAAARRCHDLPSPDRPRSQSATDDSKRLLKAVARILPPTGSLYGSCRPRSFRGCSWHRQPLAALKGDASRVD